jgi:hypothetical protein
LMLRAPLCGLVMGAAPASPYVVFVFCIFRLLLHVSNRAFG